jgi:hypothetical protein
MSTTKGRISIRYNVYWANQLQLTSRLQAGTANEEAVNIGLGSELAAVLLADGATVDDTDLGVDLLGLLSGSDLTGTNGPGNKS